MIAACTLRSMIQSPLFFSIESSLFRASDLLKLLADMYLKTTVALLLLLFSSGTGWVSEPTIKPLQPAQLQKTVGVGLDLCPTCVQFAGEFLNVLLNIILNGGVIGGCADLCQLLADKVGSKTVGEVCDLFCVYVGIEEFIKIIENADLDPIYYCELLKLCPIVDNGDAHIMSLEVKPKIVEYGHEFHIIMLFQTQNGTGTGEIDLLINTQDGLPVGENELNEPLKPGTYNVTWSAKAKADPNCDPTQGPCEMWLPGNYTANVAICNGECGSKHPNSKVYDTKSAPFNVTRNN